MVGETYVVASSACLAWTVSRRFITSVRGEALLSFKLSTLPYKLYVHTRGLTSLLFGRQLSGKRRPAGLGILACGIYYLLPDISDHHEQDLLSSNRLLLLFLDFHGFSLIFLNLRFG